MALSRAVPVALALVLMLEGHAEARCARPVGNTGLCLEERTWVPPLRVGLELMTGWHDAAGALDHRVFAVGAPFDVRVAGPLWLGVRVQYTTSGDAGLDADGDGRDDDDTKNLHMFVTTGGPRLVVHSEAARREAWRFEAGAGYAAALDDVLPGGPVLELAIGRQAGLLLVFPRDDSIRIYGEGRELTLTLRVQQGLADMEDYRAVLLGASYTTERLVRLPKGRAGSGPALDYVFGGDFGGGPLFESKRPAGQPPFNTRGEVGLGLYSGLAFGETFDMRARVDFQRFRRKDGDSLVQYAFLAGFHTEVWQSLFFETLVGYAFTLGTTPPFVGDGAVVDAGVGVLGRNALGCGLGMFFRLGTRVGLGDARGVVPFHIAFGVHYESETRRNTCPP